MSPLKSTLKAVLEAMALVIVFPAALGCWLGQLALGSEKAFPGWSQFVSLFPGLTGAFLRRAFYRLTLPRCAAGSWIGFGSIFSHATAEIGSYVYIGPYCCLGAVTLEDDVLLGSQVSIMNGGAQHSIDRLDIPIREQPGVWPRVTIGRDTWIGDRAVVLASIGKHCVVGAGSVVTKELPDYAIAVGVPAKIVRFRNDGVGSNVEAPVVVSSS